MHPSEILERYRRGERDFRELDIDDEADETAVPSGRPGRHPRSFEAAELSYADFSRSFIVADFRRAVLRGACFRHANVKTCSFADAVLCDADFSNAALCSTTFAGADLTGARFDGASAYSTVLGPGELPWWCRR